VGANKQDWHLWNANHPRDFKSDIITDIALAEAGHQCPNCSSTLTARRGIEVGHIFKLGTRYTESSDTSYPDQDGDRHPIIMGCYGIGVGRLLAAAIEQHHDDKGIVYPDLIAPYLVLLTALNVGNEDVSKAAEALYDQLQEERIEVLYDDRAESAGVKFNDADLLGLPVRLVVSPRNVKQDIVEVKRRSESEAITVPTGEAVAKVRELLSA
jgi:prolyl-tRNA synthetase